jgi:hypothetical protein
LHRLPIRSRFGICLAFIQSVKKKDTMLMRGLLKLGSRTSLFTGKKDATHNKENKGGSMKKPLAVAVLAMCVAVPSFAADVVGHSVKATGKETYKAAKVSAKAAKVSAKETGKSGKAVVKFLF